MGEDIYDKYKRMTFAELRRYLKDQRTIQKVYYFLPAALSVLMILGYCSRGWAKYPSMMDEMSQQRTIHADFSTFGMFDWIFCLVMVPLLPFEKTHIKFDFASGILTTAYMIVKLLLFDSFDIMLMVTAIYFFLAAVHLRVICKRIVFLKGLPDYPFLAGVELERQREIEVMKYSENNHVNQKLIKQAEKKVEGTVEEKLEQLPKRHIESYRISRGDFDDTEAEYTDKLIGEDLRDGYEPPEFEDINEGYKEDFRSENVLTMERRERIDEIDGGFEGDYMQRPADLFTKENFDEASEKFKLRKHIEKSGGVELSKEALEDTQQDYGGDLPELAAIVRADFAETEEGYSDELAGDFRGKLPVVDEKKETGYKPVV